MDRYFTKLNLSPARTGSLGLACVGCGIVYMRGKILTAESEYGRRSREENGKEALWNPLAALPRELAAPSPLPCIGFVRATIFCQLRRLALGGLTIGRLL